MKFQSLRRLCAFFIASAAALIDLRGDGTATGKVGTAQTLYTFTTEGPAPSTPDNFNILFHTPTSIFFLWDLPAAVPGHPIARYELFRNGLKVAETATGDENYVMVPYDPSGNAWELFTVRAVDDHGVASPFSYEVLAPHDEPSFNTGIEFKNATGQAEKFGFKGLLTGKTYRNLTYEQHTIETGYQDGQIVSNYDNHVTIKSGFESSPSVSGEMTSSNRGDLFYPSGTWYYLDTVYPRRAVLKSGSTTLASVIVPDTEHMPPINDPGKTDTSEQIVTDTTGPNPIFPSQTRRREYVERLTLGSEWTDAELRAQAAANHAEASAMLEGVDWYYYVAKEGDWEVRTGGYFDGWPEFVAQRSEENRQGGLINMKLTSATYRLRTANTAARQVVWAEVFYPPNDGTPQVLAVRQALTVADPDGAVTAQFSLAVPAGVGGINIRPLGTELQINVPNHAQPNTPGPRLLERNAFFAGESVDLALNLPEPDFLSSVIVSVTGDALRLIAIDPEIAAAQGDAAAIAAGVVIASGTDLWSLQNRPGVGGWRLVALGTIPGSATVTFSITANGVTWTQAQTLACHAMVQLAVDANRDGQIKFGSEDGSDVTSVDKSFSFWVNDDDDATIVGGIIKDTVPMTRPDWQDKSPASARDMEDFARIWIDTSGITASLKPKSDGSADLYLGLKWSDTGGTNPGIRVFRHRETDGGTQYLTDENVAYEQSLGSCVLDASGPSSPLDQEGIVTGTQVYVLEPSVFATLSGAQPVSHLLLEGCKVGKGQLKVVILKKQAGSFTTVSEGHGVWLNIMNIKSMYERAVATTGGPLSENGVDYTIPVPSDLSGPDDNNIPHPTMGWAPNPLAYPYQPDPAETKTYIIYVHGWRWSPEKANNRTETVFKRLWHLGYKGRLAALRWPTFYGGPDDDDSDPGGIFTYNNSEYRAWKSGESLKLYVNQLPTDYARHVVAHSMGNIVTGAALKNGMSVANYIMLNAAVPAMCYDESTSLRQPSWNYTTPNTDPDAGTRSLAYVGKFGTLTTNVVNFFLTNDSATRTLWEINNSTWRPQRYNLGTTGYGYDPSVIVGRRLYVTFLTAFGRYLTDPHEAMPYASQSLTRTAGADGRTRGSIGSVVDLDASFGFGDEHGAEWDRTYHATRAFYVELMRTLQIPVQP